MEKENPMSATKAEIDKFNKDFDMFEEWKGDVLKEVRVRTVHYDFDTMAPDEPQWHKNLQKANVVKQQQKALRYALQEHLNPDELPTLDEIRVDPNAWKEYCEERELKRKPHRPKSKKKISKPKRSELMKTKLKEHGITVDKENKLLPFNIYSGWYFTVGGRIKYKNEPTISVHFFLKNYV